MIGSTCFLPSSVNSKTVRHRPVIAKIAAGGVGFYELLPGINEVEVVQPRMVASADDVDMAVPRRLMVKSAMVMCSAAMDDVAAVVPSMMTFSRSPDLDRRVIFAVLNRSLESTG